jgi:hypothetical protein
MVTWAVECLLRSCQLQGRVAAHEALKRTLGDAGQDDREAGLQIHLVHLGTVDQCTSLQHSRPPDLNQNSQDGRHRAMPRRRVHLAATAAVRTDVDRRRYVGEAGGAGQASHGIAEEIGPYAR